MNKKLSSQEQQFYNDLMQGKYKDCFVGYIRKSTDEANNQMNSIEYQKKNSQQFVSNHALNIAPLTIKGLCTSGWTVERHSGFKESGEIVFTKEGKVQYEIDRPKFNMLMQFLNAGYLKGIICLNWDRLSRNKVDDTVIRRLMKKGIEFRFVFAQYDNSSAGELHKDIDGMFAQHHSRVTSEKVRLVSRLSRDKGLCTFQAPIGYLNTGSMHDKPFDPERAHFIKEIFKLYASNHWSLRDIAAHVSEQGMTTVPSRPRRTKEEKLDETIDINDRPKISRPITANTISRILRNRFYTGKIENSNGEWIKGTSHKSIIDNNTFEKVQVLLNSKKVSIHYSKKVKLPLRGMIRCSECNRVYTPYIKKGIQYYYVRCKESCSNKLKSVNYETVSKLLEKVIANLYFTDEQIIEIESRLNTEIKGVEEKRLNEMEVYNRKRKTLLEEQKYLSDNKLQLLKARTYTPEQMLEEEKVIAEKIDKLLVIKAVSEQQIRETLKNVINFSELLKNLVTLYTLAYSHEKEQIIKNVFSELYISNSGLKNKLQMDYQCFENKENAVCYPTTWLSELVVTTPSLKDGYQKAKTLVIDLKKTKSKKKTIVHVGKKTQLKSKHG